MSRTFMDIMTELNYITEELDEKIFNDVVAKPKASEWIPVTAQSPECNGRYLVTNEAWGANEIEINVWEHGEWYYNTKPIAWMPLPKPYKTKKVKDK